LRNTVPSKLFEFFQINNSSLKGYIVIFHSLFGAVVLQVFIVLRFFDFLLPVENVSDIEFVLEFARILFPMLNDCYFLNSRKMDIKIIIYWKITIPPTVIFFSSFRHAFYHFNLEFISQHRRSSFRIITSINCGIISCSHSSNI
jgi:hypothetical protein